MFSEEQITSDDGHYRGNRLHWTSQAKSLKKWTRKQSNKIWGKDQYPESLHYLKYSFFEKIL